MRWMGLVLAAVAGCAAPECAFDLEGARAALKAPEKVHEVFLDQVRCGQSARARDFAFSERARRSLSEEEFYFVVQWELVRRLILGFEQHRVSVSPDGASAVVLWCNREFGISRQYGLLNERIGRKSFWKLDLTREQMMEMKDAAFAWFERQKRAGDGRLYAYPPGWKYASAGDGCRCAIQKGDSQ